MVGGYKKNWSNAACGWTVGLSMNQNNKSNNESKVSGSSGTLSTWRSSIQLFDINLFSGKMFYNISLENITNFTGTFYLFFF